MVFLISATVSFITTIIYGLFFGAAKKNSRKYLQKCSMAGIILIPIVGLSEGSLYSHGFDIHWFIFGLVNFFVILFTAIIIVGSINLYANLKTHNKQIKLFAQPSGTRGKAP